MATQRGARKYAHAMKHVTLILLTGVFPDTRMSSTDLTTDLSKLGSLSLWSWSSSFLAPERARKAFLAFLRDSACRVFFFQGYMTYNFNWSGRNVIFQNRNGTSEQNNVFKLMIISEGRSHYYKVSLAVAFKSSNQMMDHTSIEWLSLPNKQ